MFPHRAKYTECEYDIQNNNLLYKIHPKCKSAFESYETNGKWKKSNTKYLFYYIYNFHNSSVIIVVIVIFVYFEFFVYFVYSYIYIDSINRITWSMQVARISSNSFESIGPSAPSREQSHAAPPQHGCEAALRGAL